MKRTIGLMMTFVLLAVSLTACQTGKAPGKTTPAPTSTPTSSPAQSTVQPDESQVIRGIVNKLDSYLVLLTEAGEYQTMIYGEGVSDEGLAEGDKVSVTYTGTLGDEDNPPVITDIKTAG